MAPFIDRPDLVLDNKIGSSLQGVFRRNVLKRRPVSEYMLSFLFVFERSVR